MSEAARLEAKALARAKARARRARARAIRRRTFRGSLALFAVLWAIVFAQLASGEDPALSHASHAKSPSAIVREPEPADEPEFDDQAEAPLPEVEFAPEAEPEEEFLEPEPEPAPIVTGAS